MKNNNVVRIGVLGCSDFAMRSMIPSMINLPDHYELVAVTSRDAEKSREISRKLNIKRSFNSYEQLLDCNVLEAIYIPLPNSLHFKWVKIALERGLHVLVEKSMACSLEDVKYINKIASKSNLVLVENFQFRFHKQLAIIEKMISDGVIGELRCVRSSFGFPPFKDTSNIRYKKELGGGSLLDAGAYPIKIAQIFLGQDIEVSAANLCFDHQKDIDIWGGAYVNQKNGPLFAEIAFGFDNFYQCNLELWGSEGTISTKRIFTTPPDYSSEIMLNSSNDNHVFHVKPCNHFEKMMIHFHNLINTKEGLSAEYKQNINQSRLIFEASTIASKR
jgi:dTDP-3,4-didehydro-2,6-dideoxy-alpha-D-glucose 3-reductase